jgi:hypothetical protein
MSDVLSIVLAMVALVVAVQFVSRVVRLKTARSAARPAGMQNLFAANQAGR